MEVGTFFNVHLLEQKTWKLCWGKKKKHTWRVWMRMIKFVSGWINENEKVYLVVN